MENTSEIEVEFIDDEPVAETVGYHETTEIIDPVTADNAPRPDFVIPKFVPTTPASYNLVDENGTSLETFNFNAPTPVDPEQKIAAKLAMLKLLERRETQRAEAERARKGRVKRRKKTAKMAKASRRRNR